MPIDPVTFATVTALMIITGAALLYNVGALEAPLFTQFLSLGLPFLYNSWLLRKGAPASVLVLFSIALALGIVYSAADALWRCGFECREALVYAWALVMGLALCMMGGVHLVVSESLSK